MALRVGVAIAGFVLGFFIAHGIGRLLLGVAFAAAGILFPGFFLSKAASRRAEKIDMELPHFVDQLALIIEAGKLASSRLAISPVRGIALAEERVEFRHRSPD